jgi:hypothetical protein
MLESELPADLSESITISLDHSTVKIYFRAILFYSFYYHLSVLPVSVRIHYVFLTTYRKSIFSCVTLFFIAKVNSESGIGLSYWPARLRRVEGLYDNPMPEATCISPSQGLRIWLM